jgi:hypothetical protein
MFKYFVFAAVALGVFDFTAHDAISAEQSGTTIAVDRVRQNDQIPVQTVAWRRWRYTQPVATSTVPCTPKPSSTQGKPDKVSTMNYPPMESSTPVTQYVNQQQSSGSRWYPFYGYRRPSYLDQ